jgi:glycosyltransferase involved in cell wall biosynthesis
MRSRARQGKKVVFFSLSYGQPMTGGVKYDHKIISYLKKAGLDVVISTFDNVPRFVLRSHILLNFWIALCFFRSLESCSIVLVNSYLHSRVLLITLLLKVFKSTRTVSICHHLAYHDLRSGLLKKLDKPLEGFFLHLSDKIITVSKSSMNEIRSLGVRAQKIEIIPDGIDRPSLMDSNRSGSDCLRLLFVGTCYARKGVIYLLEAMSLLRGYSIKLSIVGNTEDDPIYSRMLYDFVREASLEEDVTFHGWIPEEELCELYSQADVFVLPSLWEGYGIVLMEAMSSGLPIVATDTGAIPELVRNGENGILVHPKDSQALADAIRLLAQDPILRARLGVCGRRMASSFLSWEEVGQKVYLLLKSL